MSWQMYPSPNPIGGCIKVGRLSFDWPLELSVPSGTIFWLSQFECTLFSDVADTCAVVLVGGIF